MAIQMRRGLMYIVIELQASDGKAVSSVSCHSAVILDETGMSLRQESYTH